MSGARAALLFAFLLAAGAAAPVPAPAQELDRTRLQLEAEGAVSLSDVGGLRIGRDMRSYGPRITLARRDGLDAWVDAIRFARPGLPCLSDRPCNDQGWIVRAGAAVGLSPRPDEGGLAVGGRAGIGAAFSENTTLAYLFGLGMAWRLLPRLAPFAEVRWEHTTGINVAMLAAGLRVDL